jgi:hypothetical protein
MTRVKGLESHIAKMRMVKSEVLKNNFTRLMA